MNYHKLSPVKRILNNQTSKLPNLYWKSIENRKNFLDEVAKKLNIKTPSDWGNITVRQFRELGGAALLGYYYKGSLFECLQSVYKDTNWKREWFDNLDKLPQSYWKSTENRKNFLDEMAKKLNIKTPSDWGNVSQQQFYELGGSTLLSYYYNNSLFECLQSVYKDTNWKREWFPKLPHSYWNSMENRKNCLDEIAKKLNIKTPSDWGKITIQQIRELGGSSLINSYNCSLFTCLRSIYKDINWKREWFDNLPRFPKAYWKSMQNQKKILDEIAKKLNIKTPSDWGKVTQLQIYELGGNSLLSHYYNGSLFACLQSVYKDTNWKREWFMNLGNLPKSYWKSIENRKNFLDEIAKKLKIKTPSDWGNVTKVQFNKLGGGSLLSRHRHKGSLFACLQSVYKDINWKREWFRISNKKFPPNHFQSFKNQLVFFDNLAQQYNLRDSSDWRMISTNLIKKQGGGPLLAQYNNSISNALNAIYPSMNLLLKMQSSTTKVFEFTKRKLKQVRFIGSSEQSVIRLKIK